MLGKKVNILLLTLLTLLSTAVSAAVNTQYNATVCGSGTYLFGCQKLTSSGTETNTLGDSTVTLHLLFAPLKATSYTATIEPGQTYLFGCQQLTADAVTSNTLQQVGCGCDSTVTLTLKVQAPAPAIDTVKVQYEAAIKTGETYLFGCAQLTASGTYSDTLHLSGKDSIVFVNLTVAPAIDTVKVQYDATIKQGETYLFGCKALTAAGDYADTLHLLGVDSITVLTLKVCQPDSSELSLTVCDSITWKGTKYTTSGDYTFDTLTVTGCDSVITLHLTIYHSESSTEVVDTCNMYTWHGVRYTKTDIYYDTLQTVHGCDSICKLDLTITLPYQDTLTLEHYYGDRVIMINRHEINALGWKLDSLDLDHPEYVKWYRINAPGDTTFLDNGYYYTLTSGEPLPAGTYYAVIDIEPTGGARCGAKGVTEEYTVKGAAPAPALMPSLARPGQDIRIVNLNPMVQTNVRIYSADGLVQGSYTVSGEESYAIKAAGTTGFYLVELYNEGMKSTLRYIVK